MERKARFIAQLKTGNIEDRTVADLGGDELGNAAAATKAVATGDPRYVEQVSLEDDVEAADGDGPRAQRCQGPQRRGAALGGAGGHRGDRADGRAGPGAAWLGREQQCTVRDEGGG